MIRLGTKKIIPFYEDYKPVEVRRNTVRIAGWLTETKSGEAVDFENTYNDKAKLLASGNSVQEQTVQGKNLFDKARAVSGKYLNSLGNAVTNASFYHTDYIGVLENTQYVCAKIGTSSISYLVYYDASKQLIGTAKTSSLWIATGTIRFTTPAGTRYIRVSGSIDAIANVDTLQIELGTTATAYEPFVPNSPSSEYPSPVLSAEGNLLVNGQQVLVLPVLRKIGDVADTYNPVTGEYVQRIGKLVLTGNEPQIIALDNNTVNPDLLSFSINFDPQIAVVSSPVLCTHFIEVKSPRYAHRTIENISGYGDTTADFVGSVLKSRLITVDTVGFKAFLAAQYAAGTPVTVYYQLAEPVVTYLDPATVPTYPWYTKLEQDGTIKGTIEATVKTME